MKSGSTSTNRNALYGRKWREERAKFLALHPFCAMCEADGKRCLASVVDHVRPHNGDRKLFWRRSNWQPLCDIHHNSTKQKEEKGSMVHGYALDGTPKDPNHHWNDD